MLGLTKTSDYNLMRDDRDATVHMVQHLQKREKQLLAALCLRTTWHDAAIGQVVALQERLDELHLVHGKILKERDEMKAKLNYLIDTLRTVTENE